DNATCALNDALNFLLFAFIISLLKLNNFYLNSGPIFGEYYILPFALAFQTTPEPPFPIDLINEYSEPLFVIFSPFFI
ncbi:MAG: hypothetical protein WCS51_04630, partial [Bacilli bacterium]